jgi:hypothetical protein
VCKPVALEAQGFSRRGDPVKPSVVSDQQSLIVLKADG